MSMIKLFNSNNVSVSQSSDTLILLMTMAANGGEEKKEHQKKRTMISGKADPSAIDIKNLAPQRLKCRSKFPRRL